LTASVIIPTYNYAQFIRQAIESVIQQQGLTVQPQIIVVDDGSTDDTAKQLEKYIQLNQIEYVVIQQGGKALATSTGIMLAKGDIIFTLDADDYFLPGKIKTTLDIFEQHPSVVHVASPALIVHEATTGHGMHEKIPQEIIGKECTGQKVMELFLSKKMLFGGGSTFSARASCLKQMYLPATIDMYTDEWLVMNALFAGNTYFHESPLSVWKVHGGNFSVTAFANAQNLSKQQRLLASSGAVLKAMEIAGMPQQWKNLYKLKDGVRKIFFKEMSHTKTMNERFRFFKDFILSGKYKLSTLHHYRALNRLLK
jgi:glycosyltransferase involved in cell wall biosynthesis